MPVPLLIENTAGGDNAMARRLDGSPALGRDRRGRGRRPSASASTPATPTPAARNWSTVVDRVKAITGRIDLVHANDSRDEFDSGADRHANFGDGTSTPRTWSTVVRAAGHRSSSRHRRRDGQAADIAWLRKRVEAVP